MVEVFVATPTIADKATSPLDGHLSPGTYGKNVGLGIGVTLSERFGLAICDVCAWPDEVDAVRGALPKTATAFEYAPARWTVLSEDPQTANSLNNTLGDQATVVDLSHGRTVIRMSGPKVEWVLAKLFAIDFHINTFKPQVGLATAHHEINAHIWRDATDAFDVIVFRSYARSFWEVLCRSAEEVGYEVVSA